MLIIITIIIIILINIIIIIMCQVYCTHRWSWPSRPLCRQFSLWVHCWGILFVLLSYLDCLCILFVVLFCVWCNKPFRPIFSYLIHQPCSYGQEFIGVFFRRFWEGIYPSISITSSFVFFSVHDILTLLLKRHISATSCLLSSAFFQCPTFTSMQKDGPYLGFNSVDFGVKSDKAILFFIKFSVSHLASGIIVKSKCLKVPNCFILILCTSSLEDKRL